MHVPTYSLHCTLHALSTLPALMPCRTPSAVTYNLKHIFITDEVLSDAFHRFARISHTHRRHGSNVPGPLEARRRLAKRKMGMAAVINTTPPPGGDFGALFGFGAEPPGKATKSRLEKGFRWEAPTQMPLAGNAVKREGLGKQWPAVGSDGLPLEQQQGDPSEEEQRVDAFLYVPFDDVESDKTASETQQKLRADNVVHKSKDPVEISKTAFEALLRPTQKQDKSGRNRLGTYIYVSQKLCR